MSAAMAAGGGRAKVIIPVRVPADARPVLASERRFAANRGHPLDDHPCPVCDLPLGSAVTVLILAGIAPWDRKQAGVALGGAVLVHAACAGVPGETPENPPHTVTFDVTDPDARHALTQALEDYAARERDQAEHEGGNESRERWAGHADRMRAQAEAAR